MFLPPLGLQPATRDRITRIWDSLPDTNASDGRSPLILSARGVVVQLSYVSSLHRDLTARILVHRAIEIVAA